MSRSEKYASTFAGRESKRRERRAPPQSASDETYLQNLNPSFLFGLCPPAQRRRGPGGRSNLAASHPTAPPGIFSLNVLLIQFGMDPKLTSQKRRALLYLCP
jgi:hypothetical protein